MWGGVISLLGGGWLVGFCGVEDFLGFLVSLL